jgi:hypothetical protein
MIRRAAMVIAVACLCALPVQAHASATWYVAANAAPGGDGSAGAPFGSLADAEHASAPGDTIVVVAAPEDVPPLDGGIALKPGQRLVGTGPGARLTNTGTGNNGNAVLLADDVEVAGLSVVGTYRSGMYGVDVTGVNVHGNDVSGHNTSCTPGYQILPLIAPTNIPGVGVPFAFPLPIVGNVFVLDILNGWAGIMVDAHRAIGSIAIDDNYVHDAECGDGIDIRAHGTAELVAGVHRNVVTRLKQGHFEGERPAVFVDSLLAVGFQTDDSARLVVDAADNTQTFIGSEGSDCEGMFMDAGGASTLLATVDRNTFAHGIGGFSCNGLEIITGWGAATIEARITNSTYDDDPGDMIEAGNLGAGSKMRLELDNVIVMNTTVDDTTGGVIPFNIGECLLAGNAGAGQTFTLKIRNSEFTGCHNGVSALSNVATGNGVGPADSMTVDISDSRIHDNRVDNLRVGNLTPMRNLTVHVTGTDLSGAGDTAVAFDQPTGVTLNDPVIDISGDNCIFGGTRYDAEVFRYQVDARHNWWGVPGGPAEGKTSVFPPVLSGLDASDALATAPGICA